MYMCALVRVSEYMCQNVRCEDWVPKDTGRSQNRVGTYTYCTALQMEGSKLRVYLQDWPTSSTLGGSRLVQDSMWCAGASPTPPCWPPSLLMTAPPPLHLAVPSLSLHSTIYGLSKLPLHLRMRVSLNVSTSRLSRPGITAPQGSIVRLRNFIEGTFPGTFRKFSSPLPTFWFCLLLRNCKNWHWRLKSKQRQFSDPVSIVDNSR